MMKNRIYGWLCVPLFLVMGIASCIPEDEAQPEEQVDLTINIGGAGTKMASFGYSVYQSNGKNVLTIPFLGGTLIKANSIEIEIPDFLESKSKYDAAKGEVKVTYEGDIDVSGASSGEWVSEKGIVEITNFNGEVVEGKISATLGNVNNKTKVLELKDGSFKVNKF